MAGHRNLCPAFCASIMRVKVIYDDKDSLTSGEIIASVKRKFGDNTLVEVLPSDSSPEAYIYLGIQNLIGDKQLQLFFDDGNFLYSEKIQELRKEILDVVEDILNRVIIDNEERLT